MRRKSLLIGLSLAILILAGLTVFIWVMKKPQPVRVAMGFIPNVQFAPWYVAEKNGYFAEEGLDLRMDYSMDVDGLMLLGQNKKEFAVGGGDMAIIGRSQGLPITYVCTLYADFPVCIVALQDKNIRTMADLKGKSIGYPAMGTSYIALRAMLAKSGLTEQDVRLSTIGYTQVESLLAGKIDAVVVFTNNEPVQLAAQGAEFTQINSADFFPLVGHGIITSERMLRERPEMVRAFVRATIRGMEYIRQHPREAFAIVAETINLPKADEDVQYRVMLASMALWENEYTKLHGLGSSDPDSWRESQEFMLETGFITETSAVDELMSNSYLPE